MSFASVYFEQTIEKSHCVTQETHQKLKRKNMQEIYFAKKKKAIKKKVKYSDFGVKHDWYVFLTVWSVSVVGLSGENGGHPACDDCRSSLRG